MSGMAQTGMQKALDTLTGKNAYGLPTLYGVLTTTTPTAAVAGTEITTGQYGGYSRIAFVKDSWSGGSSGASTYNASIDFSAASSSTGSNVLGFEVWDGSGTRLWWQALTSIPITAGTHISFSSGQIVATVPILSAGNGFSTAYANKIVDHMTGKTTFGSPPSLYIALCSTACTASAVGSELVYTGYGARPQLTTALCNAATVTNGGLYVDVITNGPVNFPADSGGTQTAAAYFGIMDAATVGNLIGGGTVTDGTVNSGLTPDFPTGQIIFRFN